MRRARSWSAGILLIVGVMVSPVAITGIWAKTVLTDSDAYVAAVAPLAADTVVTEALEQRLVVTVMNAIESIGVGDQVDEYLSDSNLPPVVKDAITSGLTTLSDAFRKPVADLIHTVVSSDGFVNVWEQVNLVAHQKFIDVMQNDSVLLDSDGNLSLQLEPMLELVREQLVARGHGWASSIPQSEVSLVLVEAADVHLVRSYYDLLSTWAVPAAIIAVAALAAGVLLARDRRLAAIRTFAALALVMVGFQALLGIGVGAAGEKMQNPDAVQAIFGTVASELTDWIRLVAVAAVVIMVIALVWGGRRTANAGSEPSASIRDDGQHARG